MDSIEYQASILNRVYAAIAPRPVKPEPGPREAAISYLRANVDRLCKVRYAGDSAYLALRAWALYAELPAGDGEDFRDYLIEEVEIYAGQFGPCGTVAKRPAVTEALQEVIDG